MTFGAYWWYVTGTVMFLNAIAIVVLWFRQRVTLDLWLMVVMFLYVIEIPLTLLPGTSAIQCRVDYRAGLRHIGQQHRSDVADS